MNNFENEAQVGKNRETNLEKPEVKSPESGLETEENATRGAEILESPPDGSFIHGLQLFIAWVKKLVADE